MLWRLTRSTLFPYTTLFRSGLAYPFTSAAWRDLKPRAGEAFPFGGPLLFDPGERWHYSTSTDVVGRLVEVVSGQKLEDRSEEHTSELQSRQYLVCRLLLEKK